ncbi:MAG: AMP-binding protein [Candidatus Thermoplasmatota archaeon]
MTKIPYTEPEDLQKDLSSFFAVPYNSFTKVFTTAGTTGKPKKAFFTKNDINSIIRTTAQGLKVMTGITSKDVARISFEVGYGTELWGNRYVLNQAYTQIGALTIASGRLDIDDELKILEEYKPNILMDVTSRINYLTRELSKKRDLRKLGVEKILTGAEPTPSNLRKSIEDAWDAEVIVGYGTTEIGLLMAGECEEKQGMHLNELSFLTEVVDPDTGKQLPDGKTGELIFTTFNREGMPLVRYNSHDLGRIIPGICNCGLPLKKIEIKGRSDDLIPIGSGDNLFTWMFDEILFTIPEVLEYQAIFERENGMDVITLNVESEKRNDKLRRKIEKAIMKMPEIKNGVEKAKTVKKPKVKLVKPGTLDKESIKTRRLTDLRNLYD